MLINAKRILLPLLFVAIPASAGELDVEEVKPVVKKAEAVKKYGYLGVTLKAVSREVAEHLGLDDGRGLMIDTVQKDSPAEKAGLAPRDIVLKIDDQIIFSLEQLKKLVASIKPGTGITIQRIRKGKTGTVKAALGGTAQRSWGRRGAEEVQMWRRFLAPGGKPQGGVVRPGAGGPRVLFRWRDPGKGWKHLQPREGDWKELEKTLDSLKNDVPAAARKALARAMEEYRQAMEAARKARDAEKGVEGKTDEVGGAAPAFRTITLQSGDYQVRVKKGADVKPSVSLEEKEKSVFTDVSEEDLAAKLKDLDLAARKLVETALDAFKNAKGSGVRIITRTK